MKPVSDPLGDEGRITAGSIVDDEIHLDPVSVQCKVADIALECIFPVFLIKGSLVGIQRQ